MEIEINKYHTQINDELLSKLPDRVKTELIECFDRIILIQRLTSKNRKRAKDLIKDHHGKIIVDIENPHILENMDYFRQSAIHFEKHGTYTLIPENGAPGSEYRVFWDEERKRCVEGYIRESDGEWIPGYYYFYLNYCRIELAKTVEGKRADRPEGFPEVWDSDYLFFHYVEQAERDGLHGTVLKARGKGYSFKGGSMGARNYFCIRKSKSFFLTSQSEFLTKDGILTKTWGNLNFVDDNTPFTLPREYKDTDIHKRSSYKSPDTKTERGFMSEIMGVACKDDPDKGRGKRGKLLFFDESGIFKELEDTWKVAKKSVEQGEAVFGFMISAGTGGTEGADFACAKKFFYQPKGYGIKPLKNIYDKNNGIGTCGFFVPEYLNRYGCYDKNGNSDVIKALIQILTNREEIRVNTTDSKAILGEKAESPITPEEATLKKEGTIFPVNDINDRLSEIIPSFQRFVSSHWTGRLGYEDSKVAFKDERLYPIRDYPIKENEDKEGCVEIFEMPVRGSEGKTLPFRYIAGIDTYDDDEVSWSDSLGSIFILDRLSDRIVAEYTGRQKTAYEFYEICYRLLMFYGATANYENNKKGLFMYFNNKSALYLLCDTPEILKDMDIVKSNLGGNKAKGTNATTAVNQLARRLLADWLVGNAVSSRVIDENTQEETFKMNLQLIRSVGLLREISLWNPDGNFDRISATGMLMIYRESLIKHEVLHKESTRNSYSNDPFWNRIYKDRSQLIHSQNNTYQNSFL